MMADRVNKLVVLAAGKGTRMRRAPTTGQVSDEQQAVAVTGVKALIPIGRPFLDHVLHRAADAGLQRVCMVTGPRHDKLRDYYAGLALRRLSIEFAVQRQPRGTADALLAAADFVGRDAFLILNSDNCYPSTVLRQLRELDGPAVAGFERDALVAHSNLTSERIANFAILTARDDGCLERIIEKPSADQLQLMPAPVLVGMNCWRFSPGILESCRRIERSPRGEYELPDAVNHSMHVLGERYTLVRSTEPVFDLSLQDDIAEVTKHLREEQIEL